MSLTPDALEMLEAQLHPLSFAHVMAKWRALVDSLNNYGFSIYDYDNDVDSRVLLQQAAQSCPVNVQVQMWAALRELDEAFISQTDSHRRSRYPAESWHARLPKRPGSDLLADIDAGNV